MHFGTQPNGQNNGVFIQPAFIFVSLSMKIRAGVLGVGYLGRFHAQKYQQLGCQLIGVYDTNHQTGTAVAQELGCKFFAELAPLLEQIQVASITASTEAHFALAQQCLEKRIALLIEKPATENLEQAQALLKIAQTNQVKVQVGHLERFNPAFKAMKTQVQNPHFIEAWRLAPFSGRSANTSVLFDMMIHDLDLVLQLVKQPIHSIHAVGTPVFTPLVDTASVHIQFKNGCIANLNASRASASTIRQMNIVDSANTHCLDFQTQSYQPTSKNQIKKPAANHALPERQDNLLVEIQSFLEMAQNGSAPVVSLKEAIEAMQVATQIEQQINQKTAFKTQP